jgi:hypothetical protein
MSGPVGGSGCGPGSLNLLEKEWRRCILWEFDCNVVGVEAQTSVGGRNWFQQPWLCRWLGAGASQGKWSHQMQLEVTPLMVLEMLRALSTMLGQALFAY